MLDIHISVRILLGAGKKERKERHHRTGGGSAHMGRHAHVHASADDKIRSPDSHRLVYDHNGDPGKAHGKDTRLSRVFMRSFAFFHYEKRKRRIPGL